MKETLREIKKQLRLAMNGVVSSSMRTKGIDYKLNFGVAAPTLRHIAGRFTPSVELAEALWSESVRECRILATLLYPVELFTPDVAHRWVENLPNSELIDLWCFHLLHRLSFAETLVFDWLKSDNYTARQTALALATRLLIARPSLTPGFASTLLTAVTAARDEKPLDETRIVRCLERMAETDPSLCPSITEQVNASRLSRQAKEEINNAVRFIQNTNN